jgi:hypothetical protein
LLLILKFGHFKYLQYCSILATQKLKNTNSFLRAAVARGHREQQQQRRRRRERAPPDYRPQFLVH